MKPKDLDYAEILANSCTKEWQECIKCRLEPMRAYLSQDEWGKGLSIWMRALIGDGIRKIIRERQDQSNTDYLRGYVAALEQIIALPTAIEAQILAEQNKDSSKKDRGSAGY